MGLKTPFIFDQMNPEKPFSWNQTEHVGRTVLTWVWMRFSPLNQRICPLLSSLSAWSISSFSSFTSSSGNSSFWVNCPALRRKRNLLLGMEAITYPAEKTEHLVNRKREISLSGGQRKKEGFARYLSPDKFPQPEENAPHPLFQVQRLTAKWLPSKLHNHNLHKTQPKLESNTTKTCRNQNIFISICSPAQQRCQKQWSRIWGS